MSEEIVSFSQIISNAFDSIKVENAKNSVNIYDEWKKILSRIKTNSSNPNEGLNMAGHSRVIDLKNGILLIEADHPGWISLIQFHKKYILNGFRMKFPEIEFKTLAFRLKGNKGEISSEIENKDSIYKKVEKKLEIEEEINKKSGININKNQKKSEKKELPPELKFLFDDLRKSMLTNLEK